MTSKTPFEQRLLHELQSLAEATPAPTVTTFTSNGMHARRRVAIGGALAGVSTLAAATLLTGGATAAYAVEKEPDGSVTVTMDSIKDDPAGLERALGAAGVHADVTYVPYGKICEGTRFAPSPQGTAQVGISNLGDGTQPGGVHFTVDAPIDSSLTLVIESSANTANVMMAVGPVARCHLVDDPHLPSGSGPGDTPTPEPALTLDPEANG
jgi:hypothetical protein